MAHQVRITARALADIDEALTWLSQQSSQAAARWHASLLEKVQTLEEYPERCPLAAEAEVLRVELRQLLFGKRRRVYRILFTIEANVVNVLHIRHAAQDWLQPEDN